jgi:hypothetical protein
MGNFFSDLASNPNFWAGFLTVALRQTEKASPDYTIAHKVAATIDHLIGGAPISTPDKYHAQNLAESIVEGLRNVVTVAVSVQPAKASGPVLP